MIRFILAAFLLWATSAHAADALPASDVGFKNENATVAELFTSQNCPSCPPAEAYMRELATDPDVLTLEYHVDYWDGQRKDPFSDAAWTERQSVYNHAIARTDRLYTPQMIIDGQYHGVGSQKWQVQNFMAEARQHRSRSITISPHVIEKKSLLVTVNGGEALTDMSVVLVRFLKQGHLREGGKTMTNYNVVTSLSDIGTWSGGRGIFKISIPPLSDNESCAILLQDPESMRIFAARLCGL